jgi:L-alanine-DL-glutamate epimerase-like enolase superfamily enzyme
VLEGADPGRIEAIFERMWWHLHFVGRGGLASFAMAAVDIALHDLAARQAGLPLWRHLGGHDPKVPVYAGGIDLQFPLQQLLDQTRANLEKGFRAIKMKVGRERLREDAERVAAMRDLLGPDIPLLVDANMRWRVDEAIRAARVFAEHDLFWLEEPTIPDDVEGHVRISREGGLPVATGENFHTIYEFQKFIAAGALAFPEPDVATIGGITPWLKVARLAEAHNLPVTSHGVHDLHVHLLAAVPNSSFLEAHGFGLERFIEHPLVIEEGFAQAPERPGHGVALDLEALEPLRA